MKWKFRVIQSNLQKIQRLFLNDSEFICFFFRNFFELLCHFFENAAKMRTSSDKTSENIQRHLSAREATFFFVSEY